MFALAIALLLSVLATTLSPVAAAKTADLAWADWSLGLFARAKAENRFILLDLEAVWCHWCHVMEGTTYQDPVVVNLIKSRYLPVRADQDAHPDLSNRYEDYGWPATVVFASDGTEIVKRRGYIPPPQFAALLKAIIDDPSPGPSVRPMPAVESAAEATLDPKLKRKILNAYFAAYDKEHGGWGTLHKFLDSDSIEFALRAALNGDSKQAMMARQTLDAAIALIDPVWGGVYQYSVGPTWNDPHFEKIMSFQASYLRAYSLAYGLWHDAKYLWAARSIARYLTDFLSSPEGGFYVSQDADVGPQFTGERFYALSDRERRRGPGPRIDQHAYARENGWAISALALYAGIAGDPAALQRALKAARYVLAHHRLPQGGFRHDANDAPKRIPQLGDSLYMAHALLALYGATASPQWLEHSVQAMNFVAQSFTAADGGFVTAPAAADALGVFKTPVRQIDENIATARTANLLFRYTGAKRYQAMAEHALRYLAAPAVMESRHLPVGVLLAAIELAQEPLHLTVVGRKNDPSARTLYAEALRWPLLYKRVEWWDRSQGPLPNPDVRYPLLNKAAAFLCANESCSLPMFSPESLQKRLRSLATDLPAPKSTTVHGDPA